MTDIRHQWSSFEEVPQQELPDELRMIDRRTFVAIREEVKRALGFNVKLNVTELQQRLIVRFVRFNLEKNIGFSATLGGLALSTLRMESTDDTLRQALESSSSIKNIADQIASLPKESGIMLEEKTTEGEGVEDPAKLLAEMKRLLKEKNYDTVSLVADHAAQVFPRYPQVLLAAAVCHEQHAANESNPVLRLSMLKRANTILSHCLEISRSNMVFQKLLAPVEQRAKEVAKQIGITTGAALRYSEQFKDEEVDKKKKKKLK